MTLADRIIEDVRYNTGDAMAASLGSGYERREVALDEIEPHPGNRELREGAVAALAGSIEAEGLGQLPLVRRAGGGYQMIAGHHRLEAYRKLLEETGDPKWSRIPVVVRKDCDDATALRLVWATNLHNAELSPEERGRAFGVLALDVPRLREEDPERYRGVRTNKIVAELSAAAGAPVSESTVKRARRAADGDGGGTRRSYPTSREGELSLESLAKAIDRIQAAIDEGELNPARLVPYVRRLRYESRRHYTVRSMREDAWLDEEEPED